MTATTTQRIAKKPERITVDPTALVELQAKHREFIADLDEIRVLAAKFHDRWALLVTELNELIRDVRDPLAPELWDGTREALMALSGNNTACRALQDLAAELEEHQLHPDA